MRGCLPNWGLWQTLLIARGHKLLVLPHRELRTNKVACTVTWNQN
jgi:hypothetical protein